MRGSRNISKGARGSKDIFSGGGGVRLIFDHFSTTDPPLDPQMLLGIHSLFPFQTGR